MARTALTTSTCLFRGSESKSTMGERCISSAWPSNTSVHCWNCCYQFAHVPTFLPVSRDRETGVFHLSGVFCSWNCAKAYRYSHPSFCQKDTASFLPIFAFLTSHRPRYCPTPLSRLHPYDCSCLDRHHRVRFPPPKENLKIFGGDMSIEDYRQGFMIIENINWITRCFQSSHQISDELCVFARLRTYLYDFLPTKEYDSQNGDKQETMEGREETKTEPEIMIDGIDESFFY